MSWFVKARLWRGWTDVGFLSCVVSPLFALFPEGGPSPFSCWVFLMLNLSGPTPTLFPPTSLPIVAPIWRAVNDALEKKSSFLSHLTLVPNAALVPQEACHVCKIKFFFLESCVQVNNTMPMQANYRGQLLVSYNIYRSASVFFFFFIHSHAFSFIKVKLGFCWWATPRISWGLGFIELLKSK